MKFNQKAIQFLGLIFIVMWMQNSSAIYLECFNLEKDAEITQIDINVAEDGVIEAAKFRYGKRLGDGCKSSTIVLPNTTCKSDGVWDALFEIKDEGKNIVYGEKDAYDYQPAIYKIDKKTGRMTLTYWSQVVTETKPNTKFQFKDEVTKRELKPVTKMNFNCK